MPWRARGGRTRQGVRLRLFKSRTLRLPCVKSKPSREKEREREREIGSEQKVSLQMVSKIGSFFSRIRGRRLQKGGRRAHVSSSTLLVGDERGVAVASNCSSLLPGALQVQSRIHEFLVRSPSALLLRLLRLLLSPPALLSTYPPPSSPLLSPLCRPFAASLFIRLSCSLHLLPPL